MIAPITLPAEAVAMLAGRHEAVLIAADLSAAYWTHGSDDSTALFLLNSAHERFAEMAEAMGYTITPKVDQTEVAA